MKKKNGDKRRKVASIVALVLIASMLLSSFSVFFIDNVPQTSSIQLEGDYEE